MTFPTMLALGAVFLLCSVRAVFSIQCYSCHSGMDGADCSSGNKTILAKYKVDCAPSSGTAEVQYKTLNRCAKTLMEGELTRACYFMAENVRDNSCTTGNGATACLCSTDFCNDAMRQRTASGTSLLIAVALGLRIFHC